MPGVRGANEQVHAAGGVRNGDRTPPEPVPLAVFIDGRWSVGGGESGGGEGRRQGADESDESGKGNKCPAAPREMKHVVLGRTEGRNITPRARRFILCLLMLQIWPLLRSRVSTLGRGHEYRTRNSATELVNDPRSASARDIILFRHLVVRIDQ